MEVVLFVDTPRDEMHQIKLENVIGVKPVVQLKIYGYGSEPFRIGLIVV
jgi:hypothetical protein